MREIAELQGQLDENQPQRPARTQTTIHANHRALSQGLHTTESQRTFPSTSTATAVEHNIQSSERSYWVPYPGGYQPPEDLHPHYASIMPSNSRPHTPTPRSSVELSRQSSHRARAVSGARSPALRPASAGQQLQEEGPSGDRLSRFDDTELFQSETRNLMRENQMLRQRIRELGMRFRMPLAVMY